MELRTSTGEKIVSFTNGIGENNTTCRKTKLSSLCYTTDKNELKMDQTPDTIKFLEEHIGEKLLDIGLGSDIFDMTPKAQITQMCYCYSGNYITIYKCIKSTCFIF